MKRLSYTAGSAKGLMGVTIGDSLRAAGRHWGDGEALVAKHDKVRWTYSELLHRAEQVASGMVALGLPRQARVGIYAPNCAEWVVCQFAASLADLILVNINPGYQRVELEHALKKVEVSALVMTPGFKKTNYIELLESIAPEVGSGESTTVRSKSLPDLRHAILIGQERRKGYLNFDDLYKLAPKKHPEYQERTHNVNYMDATNIQFTSGTTGAPKAATLSHHSILNNGFYCGENLNYTNADRVGISVPLYHCFGMVMGNLACVTHGSTMVLPSPSFDPVATMDAVQEERITSLYGVPTMHIACIREHEARPRNTSSLRTGITAGSLCAPELMRKIIDVLGIKEMANCYGMTETAPLSFQTPLDCSFKQRTSTVGVVFPHVEAKIVDPQDEATVECGGIGELYTKGYNVMQGYWNDEVATKKAITTDGWMRTGDLAVMDEEGYVSIVGRNKDTIIRGGENISPSEVEFFLATHPDIEEVHVFGAPDEVLGEKVAAWVKMRPAAQDRPVTLQSLAAFCKGKIAHFKVPAELRIVDSFPLTITGKVMKYKMREAYAKQK